MITVIPEKIPVDFQLPSEFAGVEVSRSNFFCKLSTFDTEIITINTKPHEATCIIIFRIELHYEGAEF